MGIEKNVLNTKYKNNNKNTKKKSFSVYNFQDTTITQTYLFEKQWLIKKTPFCYVFFAFSKKKFNNFDSNKIS